MRLTVFSIMDEIEKRLEHPLDCMLEINVSGEESSMDSHEEALDAYRASKQYEIHVGFDDDGTIWRKTTAKFASFFRV